MPDNAFLAFKNQHIARVKDENPNASFSVSFSLVIIFNLRSIYSSFLCAGQLTKILGSMWKKLSSSEKKKYEK